MAIRACAHAHTHKTQQHTTTSRSPACDSTIHMRAHMRGKYTNPARQRVVVAPRRTKCFRGSHARTQRQLPCNLRACEFAHASEHLFFCCKFVVRFVCNALGTYANRQLCSFFRKRTRLALRPTRKAQGDESTRDTVTHYLFVGANCPSRTHTHTHV